MSVVKELINVLWRTDGSLPEPMKEVLCAIEMSDGLPPMVKECFLNKKKKWVYQHVCGECEALTEVSIDGPVLGWMYKPVFKKED